MTSRETTSVAKRRAGVIHSDTFTWSTDQVSVRNLRMTQMIQVPTIVKISTANSCENQPHSFNLHDGTLYLVRSVRFQKLVVAKSPENNYVTIPRDCPLTFHLVSNDDTLAIEPMTLKDILRCNEMKHKAPCNGQRVQLSNAELTQYDAQMPWEVRGRLELKDIYTETFLLCHAFVEGKLSGRQTVIPGYLSLTLSVAESMASGADLRKYISDICQLAAADYSTEYNFSDPQEIIVFTESPNNHYEWLEPRPTSTTHTKPTSTTSNDSMPNNNSKFAVYKPLPKRPLPRVPQDAQPERNHGGQFRKCQSIRSGNSKWYQSTPQPLRGTGLETNPRERVGRKQRIASSQSLESLDIDDSPAEKCGSTFARGTKTFLSLPRHMPGSLVASSNRTSRCASGTGTRALRDGKAGTAAVSPRPRSPSRTSEEETVLNHNFLARRNSPLRPISRGMGRRVGSNQARSTSHKSSGPDNPRAEKDTNRSVLASTRPTCSADHNKGLDEGRPESIDLQRTAALPSEQYSSGESDYLSIASPPHSDIIRAVGTSAENLDSHSSNADSTTAEEGRNRYNGPPAKITSAGRTPPVAGSCSSANLSSIYFPAASSSDRIGYASLDEVPADLNCLSVEEVLQCLCWLNLHKHVEEFRTGQVDGSLLMSLDQLTLTESFGFNRFGAMKLDKFAQSGWRPKLVRASSQKQRRRQHHPQQKKIQQPNDLYLQLVNLDSCSEI